MRLRGRGLDGVKLIVGDKCLGMLEAVGEAFPDRTCWSGEWQSAREALRARQAAAAALDPLRPGRPNVTKGAPKHPPVIDFCQIPESNLRINLDTTALQTGEHNADTEIAFPAHGKTGSDVLSGLVKFNVK